MASMTVESADVLRLARHMARIADDEFALSSPLYDRLARALADRPEVVAPLLAAPLRQRRALLYFAAVGYVLRTVATDHPLTEWMPPLGGQRAADDGDPMAALADLVDGHRDHLTRLCATRLTQTNEAARSTLLRPAFGRAAELAAGRGLALIELGTSAGLLLAPDRYAHTYERPDGTSLTYGTGALDLIAELRSEAWPSPAAIDLPISSRTGIDLNPIRWDDADAVTWLRSCIWPEHLKRAARLDAALAEVAAVEPAFITGDIVSELPVALSRVDDASVPVVFASHAITYLDADGRADLVRLVDSVGRTRDMVLILNEGAPNVSQLFAPGVPATAPGARTHVTIVSWFDGAASVEVQAEGGAHGIWLDFHPHSYPYAPPALGSKPRNTRVQVRAATQ
jgi:hypothetical protein